MIELKFYGTAEEVRAEMLALAGFGLNLPDLRSTAIGAKMTGHGSTAPGEAALVGEDSDASLRMKQDIQEHWKNRNIAVARAPGEGITGQTATILVLDDVGHPAPARKRGEPSPGRKRRTREEVAEDEAAEKYEALNSGKLEGAQSSTGEARLGPEDDAETAALDAADEAAEVEAARDPQNPLTLDDLRKVVGELTAKVGMAVSVKAVPAILGCKMTEVPDTQEALGEAIAKVREALEGTKPFSIVVEASVEDATPPATRKDVEAAILAYAERFGNEAAKTDRQGIMVKALGPTPKGHVNSRGEPVDFWTVPNIPDEKLGAVVKYYAAAMVENPYNREVV